MRNLSGVYLRTKSVQGKWENICFEEIPEEQRRAILFTKDEAWKDRLIEILAETINRIGEAYGAYVDEDEEDSEEV